MVSPSNHARQYCPLNYRFTCIKPPYGYNARRSIDQRPTSVTDPKTRNAAIAAACIMLGFGFVAYWMPTLMLALGERSTLAAGVFAVVFVAGFFFIFWLRARKQHENDQP